MEGTGSDSFKTSGSTFLKEFKVAAGKQPDQNPARPGVAGKGSGIRYEARAKNWDTLVDLNMTTSMRNDCVLGLAWRDYSQGPMDDDRGNAVMSGSSESMKG